jgi:hypothetical protein
MRFAIMAKKEQRKANLLPIVGLLFLILAIGYFGYMARKAENSNGDESYTTISKAVASVPFDKNPHLILSSQM